MTVCLVPNLTRTDALAVCCEAVRLLRQQGVQLVAEEVLEEALGDCEGLQFLPANEAFAAGDLVLTIGGDGTILHTARRLLGMNKPLLGINTGRLGFLTLIEKNELFKLERLAKREYTVEDRSLLEVSCADRSYSSCALNDIVVFKASPESTVELDILCDGTLVSSIRGDGVVFATPTGSTAYSMSAGGPIVDARLGGIIVTQICAHIIQMPPMVFAGGRVLQVVPKQMRQKVLVTPDGLPSTAIAEGSVLTIRQSPQTVPLLQFADADQLKTIDKKLKGR